MKPNKYQLDFAKKLLKYAEKLAEEGEKELLAMLKSMADNQNSLLVEVGRILLDYNILNEYMNLTPGQIKMEFDKLGELINYTFIDETIKEIENTKNFLKYVGNGTWDNSSYLLSLGIDFTLKKIKSKDLEKIINETIKGKIYSDRIKGNKEKIAKILRKDIKDFLEGKISVNDIRKKIKDLYNNNAKATKILVRNEIGRVQAGVNELWADEHNIEWQLFDATLDAKTTEICQRYDGEVFRKDDSNKPIPNVTTHICCRSCLIAFPRHFLFYFISKIFKYYCITYTEIHFFFNISLYCTCNIFSKSIFNRLFFYRLDINHIW